MASHVIPANAGIPGRARDDKDVPGVTDWVAGGMRCHVIPANAGAGPGVTGNVRGVTDWSPVERGLQVIPANAGIPGPGPG